MKTCFNIKANDRIKENKLFFKKTDIVFIYMYYFKFLKLYWIPHSFTDTLGLF